MKNQLLCLAIAIAAMCPNMVLAQTNPNPSVTPIHGNNYGEWTAKWWQWLLAVPTSSNPNLDTTGANCGTGQSGSVWFLSGTFPGTEGPPFNLTSSVTRTCTVPKGKSLLLPLPNTVFGAGTGDCETPVFNPIPCREYRFGDLKDVPALHAAAAALGIDPIDMSTITVTLDSVPITNLASYRAASSTFQYTLPESNVIRDVFGLPDTPGKYNPAVSDGYWLLFEPMPVGVHTIVIKTVLPAPAVPAQLKFDLHIVP